MAGYPDQYLYQRVVRAKLFIDTHFQGTIDLDLIASVSYFSKFHFIRLFKQAYGRTPKQYLIHLRLEHSKQVLQQGADVMDTCLSVGLHSITTFSSLFKRKYGVSPAAYRHGYAMRKASMLNTPLHHVPACFASSMLF